jgi:hypothetical protein
MEKLDQSYLHLLIKHPKTDISRAKIKPLQPASQLTSRVTKPDINLTIRNLYMAAPKDVAHEYDTWTSLGVRARMWEIWIGNTLLLLLAEWHRVYIWGHIKCIPSRQGHQYGATWPVFLPVKKIYMNYKLWLTGLTRLSFPYFNTN